MCVCRNSSGRGAMYVVQLSSSSLVLRVPYTRALPCLLHCSTFVNVSSLLFQTDNARILDSKELHASFSSVCKLPSYYAEL